MRINATATTVAVALIALCGVGAAATGAPEGWRPDAPREEIKPRFSYDPGGGRAGQGAFIIEADDREGLDGCWRKTLPVTGGKHYRFVAFRRTSNVATPRRSAVVRLKWRDNQGDGVRNDGPLVADHWRGSTPQAVPEFPTDKHTGAAGWTEVSGTFRAPGGATQVSLELRLLWAPNGRIEWSDVSFRETSPPAGRKVRLAAVHFRPRGGKSAEDNRKMFAPLIEDAARQRADLVVLPETLTYCGTPLTPLEVAEPIPGPSTEYFGNLARKHDLYIVAGLYQRAGPLVYNVAVLIDPGGDVAGVYRKVTLPTGEVERGVAPGNDYPVFDTSLGKIGMMVCYDGFFPEVARELTNRGAEIIAWPVWGCNPILARARAAENHVYLVSSTYTDISTEWMVSAVFDHTGDTIALAKEFGTVVVAEVDLDKPTVWRSLGEFKAKLPRHRPAPLPATPAR